jgi:hypothetical protein
VGINYLFIALLALCCLYAGIAGGAPERIGAAIFAIGSVVTFLVLAAPPLRFRSFELGVFIVDFITFFAFLTLAVFARRFWPLWVTGLLGVGIVGHLAMELSPHVVPWAYAVVLSIWSYPILALIAIGTWQHRRRVQRFGSDRSWSRSSPPSAPTTQPPRPSA